jgi:hypothetical protein
MFFSINSQTKQPQFAMMKSPAGSQHLLMKIHCDKEKLNDPCHDTTLLRPGSSNPFLRSCIDRICVKKPQISDGGHYHISVLEEHFTEPMGSHFDGCCLFVNLLRLAGFWGSPLHAANVLGRNKAPLE